MDAVRVLFTAAEAAQVAGGQLVTGDGAAPVTGFCWDSRQAKPGDLFVAVRGERVDGHDYVAAATAGGALGALVARRVDSPGVQILVDDPVAALGRLGKEYLRRYPVPVVGVTGSVGKTTTKELCHAVLSRRFRTLKNPGNLNSEIGLPVTLTNLEPGHQAAVLEMGMRALGEIAYLCSIAAPTVAVVTNVGTSHLELLGSQENIARAKSELVKGLLPGGTAVLNAADPLVAAMAPLASGKVTFYGINLTAEEARRLGGGHAVSWVSARDVTPCGTADIPGSRFVLQTPVGEVAAELPAPGAHNVLNALAAAGAGLALGMSPEEIAAGLRDYVPAGSRMRILRPGPVLIVDDTYNAAPASTTAALAVMRDLAGQGRTVAVLASMFELGAAAADGHLQVGQAAAGLADVLVAVGADDLAGNFVRGAQAAGMAPERLHYCPDKAAAQVVLDGLIRPGDTVLVKGSRGMAMEEIVAFLENMVTRIV